jgi:hypothetical protein
MMGGYQLWHMQLLLRRAKDLYGWRNIKKEALLLELSPTDMLEPRLYQD